MKKGIIIVLLTMLVLSSCNSCLHGFYGVHEEPTQLNISFDVKSSAVSSIKNYLDSLEEVSSPCSIVSIISGPEDKIICFTKPTCECYLVSFKNNKISIQAIYESSIDERAWLTKREEVNDSIIGKVENRFREEVLDKFQ
jgi:hypothetical protein